MVDRAIFTQDKCLINSQYCNFQSQKIHLFWQLSKDSRVEKICEIGFNAGHSALTWLAASTKPKVVSFDLLQHGYSPLAANFVSQTFLDRFILISGDSALSIPASVRILPELKCNILLLRLHRKKASGAQECESAYIVEAYAY